MTESMYEEVEINTPLELAIYLVNEGDLYCGASKARLTADANVPSASPFRWIDGLGRSIALNAEWDVNDEVYYKKLNWHDCIPKGKKVPCYVSNENSNGRLLVRGIDNYIKKADKRYRDGPTGWMYATPIPANELWVPGL